ncbi:DinB family protein [bacterium]|nr:DinB family protein [bacterium]MBU1652722.1 DinB family protein [bacterium]
MFRQLNDFIFAWTHESEAILKLMAPITDASLNQPGTDAHRSIGRAAWHIVTSITEMMPRCGLKLEGPPFESPVPATADEIRQGYKVASDSLVEQLRANWNDDTLLVEDDMYGMQWKRGQTLFILITHQVHHVGQLTILMRQTGLPVAGTKGPSKDEWDQYGAPPPEV